MTEHAKRRRVAVAGGSRAGASSEKPSRNWGRAVLVLAVLGAAFVLVSGGRMISWRSSHQRLEQAGVSLTHAPRRGVMGALLDKLGAGTGWLDRVDGVDF